MVNDALVWFVVGFVLFVLEFVLPGLILFFFGVGAWITALCLLFFEPVIDLQLTLFLLSSMTTLVIFRRGLRKLMDKRKNGNEVMVDEFIGRSATAETVIAPGQDGKIEFKGTSWQARSEDTIAPGEQVTIIGNESILLIVKSKNN